MRNDNTGRFALFRQLLADGVTCMFGNPGSSEENLLDALQGPEFKEFRYYLALQEGAVVAIADAFARASPAVAKSGDAFAWRRPALVQLHSYAGLANGLGMMYYARRGYTPMVVIAGEAGLRYEALDGQMAADLAAIARPFVKSDANSPCAWRVVDPGSLLRLLRRAIKTAATPPMGPVFLALPMDVLDQPNAEPIGRSFPVRTAVVPDQALIAEAARLLRSAAHPLILMGDGIAAAGAQAELTEVADLAGAVVWGGNCSEVNMRASHPLFGGYLGHMFGADSVPVISAADVVLICGTTVLPEVFPALDGVFAANAGVIHFDLNTTEIAKNFPLTIGALAEPKATLARLASALRETMTAAESERAGERRKQHEADKAARRRAELDRDVRARDRVPMQPARFMADLAERLAALERPALIFDEALTSAPDLLRYLPQDEPGTWFQTRVGMLGTGLPGTVGLKLAHPDRTVFGFAGDGGAMSTIQALATAARYGIGAKFVVCNNKSYRILKYNLQQYRRERAEAGERPAVPDPVFPDSFDLAPPDLRFDKLAQGQGVDAVRVERPDDIAPALDRALSDDKPFLIDLVLSAEP
jgi:thiamine pyrophosphate-dependent acetolactate synthase large subunit-like protein